MMAKRKIVRIDEELCNGCGECIPNCQEGALQIIDGKARLISDYFCDGLGACLGHCPMDAITIEEREAEPYDESKVMTTIALQGPNTIKAHLKHLKDHNEHELLKEAIAYLQKQQIPVPDLSSTPEVLSCGCPGSMVSSLEPEKVLQSNPVSPDLCHSELYQWPIQLHLVPPNAPFLKDAHLLIAASCSAFALGSFHSDLLRRKKLVIACPKLDNTSPYLDKLVQIFQRNNLKSVTVAIMEVPCCSGLYRLVEDAVRLSGKNIPMIKEVISTYGKIK
jgi:NAD-dependent dihydropyrimidine dehydrogenase PreA subunit